MERLLNVIMTIGSRTRIDRARLFEVIPDYGQAGSLTSAEKMFERDKKAIGQLGLPLVSERDPWDEQTVYYRIDARADDAAALDITPDEYTVLLAASRAWDDATTGGAARRVRSKLLTLGMEADPDLLRRTPRGNVESLPVITPLLEAVTSGARVSFDYRTADGRLGRRTVEPWLLGVHAGHWYLVGHDLDREQRRVFRASRIESFPGVGARATHPRPTELTLDVVDEATPDDATSEGSDDDRAVLTIAPYKALALRDELGTGPAPTEIEVHGIRRTAARRHVLGSVRWVQLAAPARWRAELAEILTRIGDMHTGRGDTAQIADAPVRTPPRIRPSVSGNDDLSRLIAEAAVVLERGEVGVDELAEEFDITAEQLVTDLQVLFLCGDMGTGWEDLIETEWDGGVVRVRNADALQHPLRLTAAETTALLAGLAALETGAGSQAPVVASARAKLRAHLGQDAWDPDQASHEQADAGDPRVGDESAPTSRVERTTEDIQRALAAAEPLVIRYSPPDRPGTTVRRIQPRSLVTDGGRSYLDAYCELADAPRRFRIDRIVEVLPEDAEPTGTEGEQPADAASCAPHDSGRLGTTVWLSLAAPAVWIAEAFEAVELRDPGEGITLARLDTPVRAALTDAVFEAAGHAEVLEPPDLREEIMSLAHGAAQGHRPSATR